jgi:hypothetical protein
LTNPNDPSSLLQTIKLPKNAINAEDLSTYLPKARYEEDVEGIAHKTNSSEVDKHFMFLGFQITVPTVTDYSTVGTGYRHDHAAHQKSDVRKSEQAPIPQPAQRVQNEQQQKR